MSKIAIVTDSNSGILQSEAKELGIFVLPMPFFIDEKLHREEIDLSQEAFYQILSEDGDVSTSQPSPADITDLWDEVLKSYDEIVHIPMSSGLSGSCQTAMMLADDYDGRVHVVDNQRISVTQKLAVFDAVNMVKAGMSAAQIKEKLTEEKLIAGLLLTFFLAAAVSLVKMLYCPTCRERFLYFLRYVRKLMLTGVADTYEVDKTKTETLIRLALPAFFSVVCVTFGGVI